MAPPGRAPDYLTRPSGRLDRQGDGWFNRARGRRDVEGTGLALGAGAEQAQPRSIRLTFAFDATGVRLVRRTPRDKPALPGDDVARPAHPSRVVAEVRTADGRTAFRRTMDAGFGRRVEVFAPDGLIRTVAAPRDSGVFSIVVQIG